MDEYEIHYHLSVSCMKFWWIYPLHTMKCCVCLMRWYIFFRSWTFFVPIFFITLLHWGASNSLSEFWSFHFLHDFVLYGQRNFCTVICFLWLCYCYILSCCLLVTLNPWQEWISRLSFSQLVVKHWSLLFGTQVCVFQVIWSHFHLSFC